MDSRCRRAVWLHVRRCLAVLLIAGGCIELPLPRGVSPEDGNANLNPALFPNRRIAGEPNDTFDTALEVIFDQSGIAQLVGTIATPEDVDIFLLGALSAGDRIIIDVGTPNSDLDPMIAIFDDREVIAFENDDRDADLGQYDPFLNEVIRHDSSAYYLAIARAPLGSSAMAVGMYEVLVTLARGGEVPAPAGQIVLLNFEGGTATISSNEVYQVKAFDTADISSRYAGLTGKVRSEIVATVKENYEGLDLDVRVRPGDSVPPGCSHSTIYFGLKSSNAFGLSQHIDPYNRDICDNAIVFTGMFTPSRFGRTLSAEELGRSIGNVASHELGHLLGLNHVANIYDVMDTTGTPNTFYLDQEFTISPLDASVFPFGLQDGLTWLMETLGPTRR